MSDEKKNSSAVTRYSEEYRKPFTIRYSDINLHGVLKTVKIFDYFQDIASEHAARMGISGYDVLKKNLAWVVYRYRLAIHKLPEWNEIIEIRTSRRPLKKLYEIRSFKGTDKKGGLLFEGSAAWILVDVKSRKPVRLDKHLPQLVTGEPSVATHAFDFSELEPVAQASQEVAFTVRMMDLDFNKHVNNSIYIGWAIEAIPEAVLLTSGLCGIDIKFIAEAFYKDRIISQVEEKETFPSPLFLHKVFRESDNVELVRLRSVWRRQ